MRPERKVCVSVNHSASRELTSASRSRYAWYSITSPNQIATRRKALLNLSVSRKVRTNIGVYSVKPPTLTGKEVVQKAQANRVRVYLVLTIPYHMDNTEKRAQP